VRGALHVTDGTVLVEEEVREPIARSLGATRSRGLP
jgi:hypothetical protein